MDVTSTRPIQYSEADIQAAILAIKNKDHSSVRKAAIAFKVPYPALFGRMPGRKSRSTAHETKQIPPPTEEKNLSRWVTRLTYGESPASPALIFGIAEELRRNRVRISEALPQPLRPIGEEWLDRFKSRNFEIAGIWTRQIDAARFRTTNYDGVKRWFNAVTELWAHHFYNL